MLTTTGDPEFTVKSLDVRVPVFPDASVAATLIWWVPVRAGLQLIEGVARDPETDTEPMFNQLVPEEGPSYWN